MRTEDTNYLMEMILVGFGAAMVLVVFAVLIALGIYIGKKVVSGSVENGEMKGVAGYIVPSVIAILISAAGFFLNFGWYRFGMLYMLVPVWYTLLLIVSSVASVPIIRTSGKIKLCYAVSHICYIASGLLMPDGGDEGPGYFFFGLVNDYPSGLELVAVGLFIISMVTMIIQIIAARRHEKAIKENLENR